ncbi:nucleolar protein 9 [Mantella aurantiaca]
MGEEKKKKKGNDKKRHRGSEGKNPGSAGLEEAPPKKQKKADKGPPSKPSDPPAKQSKKSPPENPLPRLDPKSVGYFRRVGETLQQGFGSDDDRSLFVRNVFNEVAGNELALATDMSGSLVLQKLLAVASSSQLCQLLRVLSGHWQEVCWHRSGAHVIQTALLQYPRLQSQERTEEEEEEEEPGPDLEDLILGLCSEVKGKFLPYNQDTHGSFIVRTLFQVLSGTVLNLETKKGTSAPTVSSEFDVPNTFLKQLQELSGLFCENIGVFATNKVASLGMQVALQVLHRKSPSTCVALCDDVIKFLSSRNISADSSSLLVFLKDETSSRLLERILEVSDKKQLRRLYNNHFQGQLQVLCAHPIANYTVQRLIRAAQTKKLFRTLFDELSPSIEDIMAKGHLGLITSLAEACKRLTCRQTELVSHLMEAFHCAAPASRRVTCVPLFLSLLTYEIYYKTEEEEEKPSEHTDNMEAKLQTVNYHGSVLVQHLLHFEDPSPALQSLGNMAEDDLRTVACSQAGSHVFDALLSSNTVTEKQRKKALRKLRAHSVDLARNKYGSRVLDRIWNASTMGVKEEIAQKLVERLRELQNDPVGHHIARNFALAHFVNRRKDWEEHQQVEKKRRKMFAEILED